MTRADLSHTGADFYHFSRNFMSEHQGFADLEIQDSAFMGYCATALKVLTA
jgi:hypothetical protein